MPTVFVILGILALLFIAVALWVRSKFRRGVAWVKVTILEKAVQELREKSEKAGQETDPKCADLIARADAALLKAKAAYADRDNKGVSEAADAILKELFALVSDQARKEVEAEELARHAADKGAVVIDITTTTETAPATSTSCASPDADTTKPVLALPSPDKVDPKTDAAK